MLFSFIALIFETFLFTNFVHYQFVYLINDHFIKPEDYPILGSYLPSYLYCGSLVGMTMLGLAIVGFLFKPTEVTAIKSSGGKGKLEIKKARLQA